MPFPITSGNPHITFEIPEPNENEYQEVAWGFENIDNEAHLRSFYINRGVVGSEDIKFSVDYCGICHTDVHMALNHAGGAAYPIVPGHEMVGTVVEIGSKVKKVKVGDHVGVGCMVDSCGKCHSCENDDQQYCQKGMVQTYSDMKKHNRVGGNMETFTAGGYSASMVVHEDFAIKIPKCIPLEKAGPILCSGVTMYEPLKANGATTRADMKIGIVGVGGLGTMGIKIAKALNHHVTAISTSIHKKNLCFEKGADSFILSSDDHAMERGKGSLDLIINTVSANHQLGHYLPLLKKRGTIVQLGLVMEPHLISQFGLLMEGINITGSLIGGIKSTEEVVKLCAKFKIFPEIELVTADKIEDIYSKLMINNDDAIRYILDIDKSYMEPEVWNRKFICTDEESVDTQGTVPEVPAQSGLFTSCFK